MGGCCNGWLPPAAADGELSDEDVDDCPFSL